MKKIIFTFILIITFSSNAFSDHFYKNWGVVVDIKPIYYNQEINKPTTHKTCTRHYQRKPRLENVIIGGLIGSVIGNQISNNHGAGTMGAVVGSIFAADNYSYNTSCEYSSSYIKENRRVFSHYKIKVRTNRGFKTINSNNHYSIHDIIYFN